VVEMMRNRIVPFCITLILCSINLTTFAGSEGPCTKTLSPYIFIENGDPSIDRMPLKSTDVKVDISGVIAEVTVKQCYTNEGNRAINGQYIFPASTRAAVHGMKMIIGETTIIAKVKERETAQKEFNKAKEQGKSASLLEQHRPNVFSMNLANIMPGDNIDIELKYTELLVPTDNTYAFVYPTVVGPRYSSQPEATAPENDIWIKNPYLTEGRKQETEFDIEVNVSTGVPLQEIVCDTHDTETVFESESSAKILLKDPEQKGDNRDYILKYRLVGNEVQSGLLLHKGEDENFFLLMVEPPERVIQNTIPPREYIFVVDVSGSMNGFPLNTAKELLNDLIGGLREKDTFNVILFAGTSKTFSDNSVPANEQNITEAIRFIDQARGSGSTELLSALKRGFFLPGDENTSRSILVITDGYIGAENDVFEFISENLNKTNVFAFGIGSSVNRCLIEGIAKSGQGEPFVVTIPYQAKPVASKFREYVSSPVLTNISVKFTDFETYDIEPSTIPDLFAQRPIIIFGKCKEQVNGFIEVKGRSGEGNYSKTFRLVRKPSSNTNSALKYLWARKRISHLSDFNTNANDPEVKSEITSLGLTYNLLTKYTSFIAVHDVVRNTEGPAKNVKQPLPLPKGVTNLAVGDRAKLPEPGLYILLCIMGAIAGGAYLKKKVMRMVKGS
jgi:Ca-activated chloride channel family protein